MNINFIDKNKKYTFNNISKTISMPVKDFDLPKMISINSYNLNLKSSFHITLVPIGRIIKKYNLNIKSLDNLILKDFIDFIKINQIEFLRYRNEYYFVSDEDLKTVVLMCDVSNLDNFFKLINKKYNLNLETPPTHVTLYTLPEKLGIFIINKDDLKNLTSKINKEEII